MLKIRVSRPYDDLKEFIEKLADACEVLVVYEHQADDSVSRTHIHAYVEDPKVSTDTMKNWVRKALNPSGILPFVFPKADWSFTSATDRGFITYLSKGHLDPLFVKGIEEEACRLLKTEWVDKPVKKGKVQYILKVENPVQQKLRQTEMVDEIRRRVNDYKGEEYDGKYDPIRVVRIIKQVVVIENNTVCGRYKFRDYYDTVMAHESPFFEQQMINFCGYKT